MSGTRAARFQVVLHVDEDTLADPRNPSGKEAPEPGRSELEDGTHVSAETSRRISCDCGVVRVTHARNGSGSASGGSEGSGNGTILDVGRKTRSIPPALRRALEVRDRGCRFQGCGSRFADAHHVTHWADGGETSLSNTLLLCKLSRIRDNLHYSDFRIIPTPRADSSAIAISRVFWRDNQSPSRKARRLSVARKRR